jgi:4-aminobutyrate aminotransferase-like enzyme
MKNNISKVSLRNTYKAQEPDRGLEAVVRQHQRAETGSIIHVKGSRIQISDIDGRKYLDVSSCRLHNIVDSGAHNHDG